MCKWSKEKREEIKRQVVEMKVSGRKRNHISSALGINKATVTNLTKEAIKEKKLIPTGFRTYRTAR